MYVFRVSLLIALVTLVSCGKESSKKSQTVDSQTSPVCAEETCPSSMDWKIMIVGKTYPERSRISINGVTIVDECLGKPYIKIDRSVDPLVVKVKKFYVPKESSVKINIADLGDCDTEETYFSSVNVPFDIVKTENQNEVVIHL